jgi:hypothetical protein
MFIMRVYFDFIEKPDDSRAAPLQDSYHQPARPFAVEFERESQPWREEAERLIATRARDIARRRAAVRR